MFSSFIPTLSECYYRSIAIVVLKPTVLVVFYSPIKTREANNTR